MPTMGAPFFGVAVPFGSIIGLVLYLIYYALFTYSDSDEVLEDPFAVDRLLMIALVTAVLAHYVEIHFGIAIAATRLHFFTYVGLLFIIGYLLPRLQEAPAVVESKTRKRRRVSRTLEPFSKDAWGPILLHGLMLVLMIGIMGFEYTTYSLPPDKVIESPADITAGEIFHQSLFLNARKDFADSPFIFLMIMLTWTLGTLVSASEMVKTGDLEFTTVTAALQANHQTVSDGLVWAVVPGKCRWRCLPVHRCSAHDYYRDAGAHITPAVECDEFYGGCRFVFGMGKRPFHSCHHRWHRDTFQPASSRRRQCDSSTGAAARRRGWPLPVVGQ
ncbi:MAG: hypothetical protein R3E31_26745 [Chloroflexota bacterium]